MSWSVEGFARLLDSSLVLIAFGYIAGLILEKSREYGSVWKALKEVFL